MYVFQIALNSLKINIYKQNNYFNYGVVKNKNKKITNVFINFLIYITFVYFILSSFKKI